MKKHEKSRRKGRPPSSTSLHAARTRKEIALAELRELEVRRKRGELVEVKAIERRVVALFRLVRDRLDCWVARVAPVLGGELHVDEGAMRRALNAEMRKLQRELAEMDVQRALGPGGEERDEDDEAGATAGDAPSVA